MQLLSLVDAAEAKRFDEAPAAAEHAGFQAGAVTWRGTGAQDPYFLLMTARGDAQHLVLVVALGKKKATALDLGDRRHADPGREPKRTLGPSSRTRWDLPPGGECHAVSDEK